MGSSDAGSTSLPITPSQPPSFAAQPSPPYATTGASKPGGTQSPAANGQINQGSTPTFGQPSPPSAPGFGQPDAPSMPSFGQPTAPMTPDPSGSTVNQTSASPMVAGASAQNGVAGTASTYLPPSTLPFNATSFLQSFGNSAFPSQGSGATNPFGSGATPSPLSSSSGGSNPSPLNSGSGKPGGGTQSGGFGG